MDENYRNFVVSRLNVSLDIKLKDEHSHIDDVVSVIFIYKLDSISSLWNSKTFIILDNILSTVFNIL